MRFYTAVKKLLENNRSRKISSNRIVVRNKKNSTWKCAWKEDLYQYLAFSTVLLSCKNLVISYNNYDHYYRDNIKPPIVKIRFFRYSPPRPLLDDIVRNIAKRFTSVFFTNKYNFVYTWLIYYITLSILFWSVE